MRGIRRLIYLIAMVVGIAMAPIHVMAVPLGPGSASRVSEYEIGAKQISHLVQLSDGTILYGSTAGTWDSREPRIGRVGPSGPLGETAGLGLWMGEIAAGSEGDVWAATVDDTGESWLSRSRGGVSWSQLPGTAGARALAPRADGGIWFLQLEPRSNRTSDDVPKVGYATASGKVVAFSLPDREAGLSSIVEGYEGDAWFTEHFADRIGRMTPAGELVEFALRPGTEPSDLTVDAHGNFWFAAQNGIGRITPTGKTTNIAFRGGFGRYRSRRDLTDGFGSPSRCRWTKAKLESSAGSLRRGDSRRSSFPITKANPRT